MWKMNFMEHIYSTQTTFGPSFLCEKGKEKEDCSLYPDRANMAYKGK